jgi:hypothetical protein
MMKSLPGSLVFAGMISNDPNPPIATNYMASDSVSQPWASIVFHCPIIPVGLTSPPRLLCAKLSPATVAVTVSPTPIPSVASSLAATVPVTVSPTPTPSVASSLAPVYSVPYNSYEKQFKSTFLPSESSGASGSFALSIDRDGKRFYQWSLNLTNFVSLIPGCSNSIIQANGLKCKCLS